MSKPENPKNPPSTNALPTQYQRISFINNNTPTTRPPTQPLPIARPPMGMAPVVMPPGPGMMPPPPGWVPPEGAHSEAPPGFVPGSTVRVNVLICVDRCSIRMIIT